MADLVSTYCFAKDNDEIQLQLWEISTSDITIHLANDTSLCLDAGNHPSDNGGVQLWSCNDSPQQQWSRTKGQGIFETANSKFTLPTFLPILPSPLVKLSVVCQS